MLKGAEYVEDIPSDWVAVRVSVCTPSAREATLTVPSAARPDDDEFVERVTGVPSTEARRDLFVSSSPATLTVKPVSPDRG